MDGFSSSWTILKLSMPMLMFMKVSPMPVGKGAAWPSLPPALVPAHAHMRSVSLSPMIQNYRTQAFSHPDERKNTSIKLIIPDSDTHPPSTAGSTSENAIEFLPTTAARTQPRPRTQARFPHATHAQRLQLAVHPLLAYLGRHAVFFLGIPQIRHCHTQHRTPDFNTLTPRCSTLKIPPAHSFFLSTLAFSPHTHLFPTTLTLIL